MLFPNKRKYIGIDIGQNELKNIGISNICKNPISCIPNIYIYIVMVHTAGRNEEHADEEILQNNSL